MPFKFRSVRSRYLLSGLAIALFPLLIVSLLGYFIAERIIAEQLENHMRESVSRNAAEFDGWFRKFGDILGETVEDIGLTKSFDRDTLIRIVKGKQGLYGRDVYDFYVGFDDPGNAFVSASDWIPGESYDCRERSWYRKASGTDAVVFTEPYVDAETGKMVVTVCRRIMRDGRLFGVLAADLFISDIIGKVRQYSITEHSYAFLLDEAGNIVSHPDEAFQPKKTGLSNIHDTTAKRFAVLAAENADAGDVFETRDYRGGESFFLVRRIPANNWVFGISIPRGDYRRPLDVLLAGMVITCILSMTVGTGIMLRLVGSLIRPIRALTDVIRNFSGRNLDVRVKVDSPDEIGEMGRIFNGMADTIREYGLSLENKVRERTRELQEKTTRIQESIDYAKTLQEAILPGHREIGAALDDFFVIWRPRDTVGGDFYWLRSFADGFVLVVGDCTGHGVPGALMTMAAKAIFDRAVTEETHADPSAVLAECNRLLRDTLGREGGRHVEDGLDAGVLFVDRERKRIRFGGAGMSLFLAKDGVGDEIRGERHGLGRVSFDRKISFAVSEREVPPGTSLYLATDGIRDQVGGDNGVPFGKSRLYDLLASVQGSPMDEQKSVVLRTIDEFRGNESVRDDMTLFGLRI